MLEQKYCQSIKIRTYFLKGNNNKKNIDLKEVTMTNKMIRAKSKCATCMNNKSRFLKQEHNKKIVW